MFDLNKEIKYIKGVGPARAEVLNSIGIYNLKDLITYFPRNTHAIKKVQPNIAKINAITNSLFAVLSFLLELIRSISISLFA